MASQGEFHVNLSPNKLILVSICFLLSGPEVSCDKIKDPSNSKLECFEPEHKG